MVKVVATCCIKEEKVEQYLELCKELVEATRKEKGCIEYTVYEDKSNSTIFSFIEEWEAQADLDAHMKSEHFTRIFPQVVPLLAKEMDLKVYSKKM